MTSAYSTLIVIYFTVFLRVKSADLNQFPIRIHQTENFRNAVGCIVICSRLILTKYLECYKTLIILNVLAGLYCEGDAQRLKRHLDDQSKNQASVKSRFWFPDQVEILNEMGWNGHDLHHRPEENLQQQTTHASVAANQKTNLSPSVQQCVDMCLCR
jgi:hypothetical protein